MVCNKTSHPTTHPTTAITEKNSNMISPLNKHEEKAKNNYGVGGGSHNMHGIFCIDVPSTVRLSNAQRI